MKLEKYSSEAKILTDYLEYFCKAKHTDQTFRVFSHSYKDKDFTDKISLCDECFELMEYSIKRLQNCPYEEKPRAENVPPLAMKKAIGKK